MIDELTISMYNARVFTNKLVLLQLPGWLYSPLNDRAELVQHVTDNVTNAMNNACHGYFENKSKREWKYLLLDFPDDHKLSSKEINSDAGEDKKLKLEVVPITYNIFKKKKSLVCLTHWACWKVSRTDIKSQKHGNVQPVTSLSKAAGLLASMYLTKAADGDGSADEDDVAADGMK